MPDPAALWERMAREAEERAMSGAGAFADDVQDGSRSWQIREQRFADAVAAADSAGCDDDVAKNAVDDVDAVPSLVQRTRVLSLAHTHNA